MQPNRQAGVEQAAESLLTMREARQRIAEVRKDRGFGKVSHWWQRAWKGQRW